MVGKAKGYVVYQKLDDFGKTIDLDTPEEYVFHFDYLESNKDRRGEQDNTSTYRDLYILVKYKELKDHEELFNSDLVKIKIGSQMYKVKMIITIRSFSNKPLHYQIELLEDADG